MNLILGSVAAASIASTTLKMPRLFDEISRFVMEASANGSSIDCSVIRLAKLRLKIADDGTVGVLFSATEAMELNIPKSRRTPRTIAIKEPTNVPATIFRKFFIIFRIINKTNVIKTLHFSQSIAHTPDILNIDRC